MSEPGVLARPALEPAPPRPTAGLLRRWPWLAAVGAVVVVLVGVLGVVGRPATDPSQPALPVLGPSRAVYDGDLGDPFILAVKEPAGFVAFGTGDWPARIPTASSPDLATWTAGPDALPQLPPWTTPDPRNALSWAPAVLQTDAGYLLYVTLPEARSGQQCIAVTRAAEATGPYTGVGDGPLVCQHELGGSIDPSVVRDGAGRLHLLWKNDGNAVGAPASLWEQELTADGRGVTGAVHLLITARSPWQGGIVENPAMIPASGGGWWLLYSANLFDQPEYSTGLAFCPTLDGPCRETGEGPFLATLGLAQENQFAPGGMETFVDASGARWAVFDTWNRPPRNGRFRCCRSMQLARILSA